VPPSSPPQPVHSISHRRVQRRRMHAAACTGLRVESGWWNLRLARLGFPTISRWGYGRFSAESHREENGATRGSRPRSIPASRAEPGILPCTVWSVLFKFTFSETENVMAEQKLALVRKVNRAATRTNHQAPNYNFVYVRFRFRMPGPCSNSGDRCHFRYRRPTSQFGSTAK
jgi:hypothetical protein